MAIIGYEARSSGLETSLLHLGSVETHFLSVCARGGEIGSGVVNLVTADQSSSSKWIVTPSLRWAQGHTYEEGGKKE